MPTATLTTKGQLTLPKEIREYLGVDAGDRLSFEIRESGEVLVQPETTDIRRLRGALKHKGRAITIDEMSAAVRRGASRR